MKNSFIFTQKWFLFALITTVFWGVWGALIETTEKAGFPATLGYAVWALTMIPCAVIALRVSKIKLEFSRKQIFYGALIGFTGAGGQLILFQALRELPAYLVFPIISLSPLITIILSYAFLKERTNRRGYLGIIFAMTAIALLSYTKAEEGEVRSFIWLILPGLVFFAWGIQAVFMRKANEFMRAESIFAYMAITAVLLIPFALWMTDFSADINYGFRGPYLAAMIQVLNSIGALSLVFALRYGKAMIVAPMTNAVAPIITIILSLVIYSVFPSTLMLIGMLFAMIAVYLFSE